MSPGHFEIIPQVLLVGSLLVVLYSDAGYPFVLWVWGLCQRRTVLRASMTPPVSIVIAAGNEAPRLAARIENCLKQEYPFDRLEVMAASDGSSDQTESVVHGCDPRVVYLVALAARQGKAVALNVGAA